MAWKQSEPYRLDETHPESGHVMLAVYLLRASAYSGVKSVRKINPRCLYIASIKIWNAIRKNEIPKMLSVRPADGIPEVE